MKVITLDSGNDNNFSYISQNDKTLESIENQIKGKIDNFSELYHSFIVSYNTNDVIVPI